MFFPSKWSVAITIFITDQRAFASGGTQLPCHLRQDFCLTLPQLPPLHCYTWGAFPKSGDEKRTWWIWTTTIQIYLEEELTFFPEWGLSLARVDVGIRENNHIIPHPLRILDGQPEFFSENEREWISQDVPRSHRTLPQKASWGWLAALQPKHERFLLGRILVVSMALGVPPRWMVFFREHPSYKWMISGGYPYLRTSPNCFSPLFFHTSGWHLANPGLEACILRCPRVWVSSHSTFRTSIKSAHVDLLHVLPLKCIQMCRFCTANRTIQYKQKMK